MSTFANSEDPDEMKHNAAFHQGTHCLQRYKRISDKTNTLFFFNYTLTPLISTMDYPNFFLHQTRRKNP